MKATLTPLLVSSSAIITAVKVSPEKYITGIKNLKRIL
jgi:hypothetical protein